MDDSNVKPLIDISAALSSALDLGCTLESILKVLSDSLEMQRGTITLVDPQSGQLNIEAAHGLTKKEKERATWLWPTALAAGEINFPTLGTRFTAIIHCH